MECLLKNRLESCLDLDCLLLGRWRNLCPVLMSMAEVSEQANDQVVRAFASVMSGMALLP